MADYTSNFSALLTGHLGINPGEGDKPVTFKEHGNTSYDTTADIRDALNFTVAGGHTNFKDDSMKNFFANLSQKLGKDQAQKLFNQAFLFNQRSDIQGKKPEEKLNLFYDIGSNDPSVKRTLETVKNFGSGVQEGYRNSSDTGSQELTGKSKKVSQEDLLSSKLANRTIAGNISSDAKASIKNVDTNP